jgi:DNA uptake protein ComE-like DNA-binding protein
MGFLKNVEEIQKEEGIGPSIFAGSKYYIKD